MAFRLTSKLSRMIFNTLSRSRADATIGDQSITASKAAVNETNQENCRDGKNAKLVLSALHETEPKLIEDPISNPSSFDSLKSQLSKITSSITRPIRIFNPRLSYFSIFKPYEDSVFESERCNCVMCNSVRTYATRNMNFGKQCKIPDTRDKCKVESNDECKKFKVHNCPCVERTTCEKVHNYTCSKQEAPYPSFSESCHEHPYNKPSECKMCPWKPWSRKFYKDLDKNKRLHTTIDSEDFNLMKEAPVDMLESGTRSNQIMNDSYSFFTNLAKENDAKLNYMKTLRNDCSNKKVGSSLQTHSSYAPAMEDATKYLTNWPIKFPLRGEHSQASHEQRVEAAAPEVVPIRIAHSGLMAASGSGRDCPKVKMPTRPEPPKDCTKEKKMTQICPQGLVKKPGYQKRGGKPKATKGVENAEMNLSPDFINQLTRDMKIKKGALIIPPQVDSETPAILLRPLSPERTVRAHRTH